MNIVQIVTKCFVQIRLEPCCMCTIEVKLYLISVARYDDEGVFSFRSPVSSRYFRLHVVRGELSKSD